VLQPGDTIPDATVWLAPRQGLLLREIADDGPFLLVFYLFDFSAT
jgi:hypothetical protein